MNALLSSRSLSTDTLPLSATPVWLSEESINSYCCKGELIPPHTPCLCWLSVFWTGRDVCSRATQFIFTLIQCVYCTCIITMQPLWVQWFSHVYKHIHTCTNTALTYTALNSCIMLLTYFAQSLHINYLIVNPSPHELNSVTTRRLWRLNCIRTFIKAQWLELHLCCE